MLFCDKCKRDKQSPEPNKGVFPIGSVSPTYYILGDVVAPLEETDSIFTEQLPQYKFLMNTLVSAGLDLNSLRFFKLTRCGNILDEELEECRECCSNYCKVDIAKTNPDLIITLGAEPTKALIGSKFKSISSSRGRLYDIELYGKQFKVLPTYSPNYVVNAPDSGGLFLNDILKAKAYMDGELVDIKSKNLEYATTYEEFKAYHDKYLVNSQHPAYDLETNAHDPRSAQARMVGFSLAPDSSTGVYVVRNSLEYSMPEEDWDKVVELTKNYLSTRIPLVHNIMYEKPFTYNEWGYLIDEFDDTLVKARMLRGGDMGSASLKDQCILNLGYPDWDTDLSIYKKTFTTMIKKLKPSSTGKPKWEYDFIRNRGLCALLDEYNSMIASGTSMSKNSKDLHGNLEEMRDIILKYYISDTDYSCIMEIIGDELCNLVDIQYDGPFSYGFIPMKVITKYGAMDAVGTQDLDVYLNSQIDKWSKELDIDMYRGYKYIKRQFVAGVDMELNGLYWNDEIASDCDKWYLEQSQNSLLNLINSPFLDNHLLSNSAYIINEELYKNHLDYVMEVLGPFKPMKSCIKLEDGTKLSYKVILDAVNKKLGYNLQDKYKEESLELIRRVANKDKDIDRLKGFYNPGSTTQYARDLVNSILITPDIRIAHFMNRLHIMLDDPELDINTYPPSDRQLFQVLISCKEYNSKVDKYNEELDSDDRDDEILENLNHELGGDDSEEESSEPRRRVKLSDRDTFDRFMQVLQNTQVQSSKMQSIIMESLSYNLTSVSEDNIIELHRYYLLLGIDLDNPDTWTDEFKFLFNFRMYKKCMKMRSTYIQGKRVGRGKVWVTSRKGLESGELLTKRTRLYTPDISEDEAYLMQASYNVCFSGDTKVKCLDGNSYSFKELVDSGKSELWVYSKTPEGKVVPGKAKNIRMTRQNSKLVEVTLDTGFVIKCTPDHPFMLRDGTYKEAQYLTSEDSLMPLNIRENSRGYYQYYDELSNSYKNVHTMVNECINGDKKLELLNSSRYSELSKKHRILVTHHKNVELGDLCKKDNTPEHLEWMYFIDHSKWHSDNAFITYNGSERHRENSRHNKLITEYNGSDKHREDSRKSAERNFTKEMRSANGTKNITAYNKSEKHKERCRITSSRPEHIALFKKNAEIYRQSPEFLEHCKRNAELYLNSEENRQKASVRMSESNKNPELNKLRGQRKIGYILRQLIDNNLDITEDNYNKYYKKGYLRFTSISRYFDSLDEAIAYAREYNHKIVSVKFLDYTEDVYDLEVPNHHNFAIDIGDNQGLFVHNCGAETLRWRTGIHCLEGNTKVKLADGRDLPIKDLYKEYSEGKVNYVYTVDDKGDFLIENITEVQLSGCTNKVAKLHLDNGECIVSTQNHRYLTRFGEYKEVRDLQEGESLMPGYFSTDESGYLEITNNSDMAKSKCHYLADEYNERYNLLRDISKDKLGRYGSWVRHHCDFNKLNNNPDNVQRYGFVSHLEIHSKSKEGHLKQWETQRLRMKEDENYRAKRQETFKRVGKAQMEANNKNESWKKILKSNGHNRALENNSNPDIKYNQLRGRILLHLNTLIQIYPELSESNYNELRLQYVRGSKPKIQSYKLETVLKYFDSFEEALELSKSYNHKVAKVELIELSEPIPVYDLSVKESTPCFLLSSGIVSHNTIPSGSDIKNIYTSRYKGGCIFAPDYSQMEIRCIAGASKCTPMLEAFKNGADIHMQNAVKIFRKPAEEILPAERRYSKMACTLGNTKIKLTDGTIKSVEELYNSGKRDFYAYSFDTESKKVVPGHVVEVSMTKKVKETYKITFDNDKSVEVTSNHKFLLLSGNYIDAKDLSEGDKIETLFYRVPTKGAYAYSDKHPNYYEQIRDVRHKTLHGDRSGNVVHPRYGKWLLTHKEFYRSHYGELTLEKPNIDHQDHNSLNNDPINLRELSQSDNLVSSWSKSDKDRFGLLAQAQNIVAMLLREGLELTESNFDQMMEHMYESRGHLYWRTVSKYYTFRDIVYSLASRSGYKNIDESRFEDPVKGKFKLSTIACRTVKSIEVIIHEEEVPVYDLSVERYHNYAIDLGDNSGVFTHNSFMILYGGDYKNFAEEYLDGDLKLGKYIYDSFYEAYPEIKTWIDERHEQMRTTGKVTTPMDYYINVSPEKYGGSESKALRAAQNYPISNIVA